MTEKEIEREAFLIWKERKRRGDSDADDADKNWFMAVEKLIQNYYDEIYRIPEIWNPGLPECCKNCSNRLIPNFHGFCNCSLPDMQSITY